MIIKSHNVYRKIYCVAFEPARGLMNGETVRLDDTVIIKDPDSFVHKVGWSRFKHPETEVIKMPNDKWWPSIKDHGMKHARDFVYSMKKS